jgi:pimeloyl-ACP methyl ester carboxylesterase
MGTRNRMNDVVQSVRDIYPKESGLDIFVPPLPYSNLFSRTRAAKIVSQLLEDMDAICKDHDRYEHIVFIGISMGGVVARRLFLAATDVHRTVPNESELSNTGLRPWAGKVERIVTLAGLNRGWLISGRLRWWESSLANLVGLMGHLWPRAIGSPTIFDFRQGAPFIVQTRLQWLALRRSSDPKPEPLVIQLLGSQDNLVAPDDAIDFAVDRGRKDPYFYFGLPNTRHIDAIVFSPSRSDRDGKYGAARKEIFVRVLKSDRTKLENDQIHAEYLVDSLPPEPDKNIDHVVFVIHGIRDDGYWTRKIAQKIQEVSALTDSQGKWRCVTSSYGYFAMLPFVLPWIRQQKVEWLMDEYVHAQARFRNARFSYVGHSNGTYLVARALEDYPAASFRNVLFAGSVVRRDYKWDAFLKAKRVSKVLNMVATRDWVVALFPMGLEPMRRFFDLGGAGFAGFNEARRDQTPGVPDLNETRYVNGGHSPGLVETRWANIANFIVNDALPPADPEGQSLLWKGLSKLSTVLLGLLLVLAIAIPLWILYPIFTTATTAMNAAVLTFLALLYLIGLRFVITRV